MLHHIKSSISRLQANKYIIGPTGHPLVNNYRLLRRLFTNGNKIKEFHERKLVGFSKEQMFSVVSDVGNYTKFVPFCKKSVILIRKPGYLKADMEIGFPPIVESYTSHVTMIEPYLVHARSVEGSLFNVLQTNWKFNEGLHSNKQSCIIDFNIIFEFKSMLHMHLSLMFFDKLVVQMEYAFIREAARRYGKASINSHKLTRPS